MKAILDTHAFLWWLLADERLSAISRSVIEQPENDILVSAITGYEIASKATRGRLVLPGSPSAFVGSRVSSEGFAPLAVSLEHAVRAGILPDIHRDPFDRILIAQAQVEGLPILTADPLIAQYDVETIW